MVARNEGVLGVRRTGFEFWLCLSSCMTVDKWQSLVFPIAKPHIISRLLREVNWISYAKGSAHSRCFET